MTKEVLVTIEGIQLGTDDDAVKNVSEGTYHYRNGKHYIHFDEVAADGGAITKNTIKISSNQIDITKKGSYNTQMTFCINEDSATDYRTPFGNLFLGIHTTMLQVEVKVEEIKIRIHYSLEINDAYVSDNKIRVLIEPKKKAGK
ncbi:MAG: hypothetical protein K0S47_619 [Herbinix sp.]|jgi:uncharacterized beta-barrel protein YwiB (DUF1934 family)|nr:hypothetical protein [Herbinix sp.]